MDAAATTLFVDPVSQPCRALALLIRVERLPVLVKRVSLGRGDQRRAPFVDLFPLGKVPALYAPSAPGGPLALPETQAIARYLLATCGGGGRRRLWPADPRSAVVADAALAWVFTTLRPAAAALVWHTVLAPTAGGEADPGAARVAAAALKTALAAWEAVWLAADGAGAGGLTDVTLADVCALCELDQLALLPVTGGDDGAPTASSLLAPCPRTRAWAARVVRAVGEADYEEVVGPLARAVGKMKGGGWWAGGGPGRGRPRL
jgi:glutathione S-transferase